jgi:hypothetical protein
MSGIVRPPHATRTVIVTGNRVRGFSRFIIPVPTIAALAIRASLVGYALLTPHHINLAVFLPRQNPMDIQASFGHEGQEIGTGFGVGVFPVRQIRLSDADALCVLNDPDTFLVGTVRNRFIGSLTDSHR